MTSERFEEMFKGVSANMRTGKSLLVSKGGRAETPSVRRRGARTPIGTSRNLHKLLLGGPVLRNKRVKFSTDCGLVD
jgi:hypothetical protein